MKKILVMGLPGSGKTTLAKAIARQLNAVHFEADEIRREINKDLKFSVEDRIEQARRMGVLCDIVKRSNVYAIADFVCPTEKCRAAFNADYVVFVDRIKPEQCRFPDTAKLFRAPKKYNQRVVEAGTPAIWSRWIESDLVTVSPTWNSLPRHFWVEGIPTDKVIAMFEKLGLDNPTNPSNLKSS